MTNDKSGRGGRSGSGSGSSADKPPVTWRSDFSRDARAPDKRTRERERQASPDAAGGRPGERGGASYGRSGEQQGRARAAADFVSGESQDAAYEAHAEARQQRSQELRLFGLNACRAAFANRPQDLRKVYLTEERIPAMKPVLAWCAQHKLGYRVVTDEDLRKLTSTQHHEGVCFEVTRRELLNVAELIALQPAAPAPALLVVLDGVGNPHNFGAVLRSAANFGVSGILLPEESSLTLSGAACRVAEGGAEAVPLARADTGALAALRAAGFAIAATVVRGGESIHAQPLPARLVLVFGAEREGMRDALVKAADRRLTIPGSGKVESLNIAASAAVLFAEFYRQHIGT
ncbi:MAG: TrmH family RNA methyltransferase [Tahibacter sp.]